MNSIEVNVPRRLIKKFYQHPEPYGDFVVDLVNGMYTDVYYDETGDFYTITNEEELIEYLTTQSTEPITYFYRNGVFAFRDVKDDNGEILEDWINNHNHEKSFCTQLCITEEEQGYEILKTLPDQISICYYWMEVGIVNKTVFESYINFDLEIYEDDFFDKSDAEITLHLIQQMCIV